MIRDQSTSPGSASDQAEYLTGGHLADLLGQPRSTRIRDLVGDPLDGIAVDWHRESIGHGRDIEENDPARPGKTRPTSDPSADDLLAIPVEVVAELLACLLYTSPSPRD